MTTLDQLKSLVAEQFENTGFLNQVRAQLQTQVYKIVEGQSQFIKKQNSFQWEHPMIKKLHESKEGSLALKLIQEFLEFCGLSYTLNVFKKEADLKTFIVRTQIAEDIGIKSGLETNTPVLIQVIEGFMKQMDANSSLVHSVRSKEQIRKEEHKTGKDSYDSVENSDEYRIIIKKQIEQEKLEKEKKEKERKEKEKQDKEKEEKAKKRQEEEKKQKEAEEFKRKEQERPKTAQIPVKKAPATAVNKIRGANNNDQDIANIYGINIGQTQKPQSNTYSSGFYGNTTKNDPYAFTTGSNIEAGGDPYAFDLNAPLTVAKNLSNSEEFSFDSNTSSQKKQNISKPNNNKAQLTKTVPANSKIKMPANNQIQTPNTKPNQFSKAQTLQPSSKFSYQQDDEEIEDEEDYDGDDHFMMSRDSMKKNPMFTSSEDVVLQSQGVDLSVDSTEIQHYDYYEPATKKK